MIPIAKGKFSQPRQPRKDSEQIPAYVPPIPEPPKMPEHDPSLDETMLLTGVFEPIKDAAADLPPVTPSVTADTMTFDEAQFLQETAVPMGTRPPYQPYAQEEEDEDDDDDDDDDLEVKEENGVLILKDSNFDNFVADKDVVLLEFYAPW